MTDNSRPDLSKIFGKPIPLEHSEDRKRMTREMNQAAFLARDLVHELYANPATPEAAFAAEAIFIPLMALSVSQAYSSVGIEAVTDLIFDEVALYKAVDPFDAEKDKSVEAIAAENDEDDTVLGSGFYERLLAKADLYAARAKPNPVVENQRRRACDAVAHGFRAALYLPEAMPELEVYGEVRNRLCTAISHQLEDVHPGVLKDPTHKFWTLGESYALQDTIARMKSRSKQILHMAMGSKYGAGYDGWEP